MFKFDFCVVDFHNLCYNTAVAVQKFPVTERRLRMIDYILSFIISVLANVTSRYICKRSEVFLTENSGLLRTFLGKFSVNLPRLLSGSS